jgi:HEAT repeat protein
MRICVRWLSLIVVVSVVLAGCCKESELPQAVQGLYSADPRDQNRSLQVLAQCGARSESSVPRIAALMYDSNVGVASSAAYALRKIDSKQAREALKVAEDARRRRKRR